MQVAIPHVSDFLALAHLCIRLYILWKLTKETSTKTGGRRACRGSSHALPRIVSCSKLGEIVTCISEERLCLASPRRECFSTLPQEQKEERFSPPPAKAQPMRDCHNLANEKPLHFELPLPSNVPFVDRQLLPTCPFLCKRTFFFALRSGLWFYHSLSVLNCNSPLLLNKPMFAG